MVNRVLVVDDSTTTARQLTKIVDALPDFRVIATAADGTEGLRLYQEHKPELVLMDMVMPVLDGLACLRAIVHLDPAARVVVISSLGEVQRKVDEAMRMGAKAVINKPFDAAQIRSVITKLFEAGAVDA